MSKKRIYLVRGLAVLALLLLAALMMVIGRGHTIYFDNKAFEYEGTSYETPYKVEVNVKGEQVAKLYDNERGMTSCMGQTLKLALEITEEKGGSSEDVELTLKLPYNMDGIVLNLPALLADLPQDAYLSQFIPAIVEEPAEEETIADEFGGMGDF